MLRAFKLGSGMKSDEESRRSAHAILEHDCRAAGGRGDIESRGNDNIAETITGMSKVTVVRRLKAAEAARVTGVFFIMAVRLMRPGFERI